jgi:hypothetical protein
MLQEHVDQNKSGSKYIFHYKQLDSPYLMVEKLAVPSIKQLVYQTSDTNYSFRYLPMGVSMFVPNNPQASKDVLPLVTAL